MEKATAPTIRPAEAAHFGKLAAEWWDPKGSAAMLHRLNPVRLAFLRVAIDAHWGGDPESLKPLAGKCALDVGCGAGLLCEPLARLGAAVTGVDAAAENIAAARAHAEAMGFPLNPNPVRAEPVEPPSFSSPSRKSKNSPSTSSGRTDSGGISYHHGELAALKLGRFDLVTCMEVLEHVADKLAFVAALAARLAPGGLLILSTPNRTSASRLLLVNAAEAVGAIPRGTHHWDDFVTPDELRALLTDAGLTMDQPTGIVWSPGRGLHLSDDLSLDYIVIATVAPPA
ncbi:MAG: methyltransferase domain-containing protein [Novosphingobium sp.]|nr:methyltransferase domain-containing protein [Novosphingobium sp.]